MTQPITDRPRANFTLDKELTVLVREMLDRHELEHGFRPTMAQFIAGLIRLAAKTEAKP